jgi:hypothetical protein
VTPADFALLPLHKIQRVQWVQKSEFANDCIEITIMDEADDFAAMHHIFLFQDRDIMAQLLQPVV